MVSEKEGKVGKFVLAILFYLLTDYLPTLQYTEKEGKVGKFVLVILFYLLRQVICPPYFHMMTMAELKKYVLEHKNDQAAFQALMDRVD